jgi:crotonobetainyl-CoA:carnitine CoA-transferase CaiB-like acyl-CoA transferase
MDYPLKGIKVVEVSTWAAGPSCGMWLAEWGADVIRVEPIEGDAVRGFASWGALPTTDFNFLWEMWNRSKRAIALDLSKNQGQDIIHNLVKESDIFLANLRPNTLAKIRLDYETLNTVNPSLIYASITGHGTKGPGVEWPAHDDLAFWARSGIGSTLGEPDGSYVNLRGAMGDVTTGSFMFGGIILALYNREKTGVGQRVDASLLSCGVWVAGVDIQGALTYGVAIDKPSRRTATNPLFNCYKCKDSKWIVFDMLQSDRYWGNFCEALEISNLVNDPRFNTFQNRINNSAQLINIIDAIMVTKTREEWEPVFKKIGLVFGLAQTPDEVINDPCVLENNYILEYDHPSRGKIKGINCPIQLSKTPSKIRSSAPEFGQHTEEILLEFGYTWEQIEQLKGNKIIL